MRNLKQLKQVKVTLFKTLLWFCLNLQQKNHAVNLSLLPPSLVRWGGESEGKEAKKVISWDKNRLAEWQGEKKTTINNTDKSVYNTQCSHHPMLSLLLSSKSLSFSQLPT